MSDRSARSALREYGRVGVHSEVYSASPHRLVQMLIEGAITRVMAARVGLARGDLSVKGENIGWAISIIDCLNASVDTAAGGALAGNLRELYTYLIRRLLEANVHNDGVILDEVCGLLREVKAGWDGIGDAAKGQGLSADRVRA